MLNEALGVELEPSLLELAFTHRSFAYESASKETNERLEFLGDSVLGLIVTEELYKRYPDLDESRLSPLRSGVVNMRALADIARTLELGQYIRLGKGEEVTNGRDKNSLLADALEALIGAIFLDGGLEQTEAFVLNIFKDLFQTVETFTSQDSKSTLQEWFQKKYKKTPEYIPSEKVGSLFKVSLFLENQTFEGEGRTIKEAEKNAASKALAVLKK